MPYKNFLLALFIPVLIFTGCRAETTPAPLISPSPTRTTAAAQTGGPAPTASPTPDARATKVELLRQTQNAEAAGTEQIFATYRAAIGATRVRELTLTPAPTRTPIPTLTEQGTPQPESLTTCPQPADEDPPPVEFLYYESYDEPEISLEAILEYLNTYGVNPILNANFAAQVQGRGYNSFFHEDMTGDGIPELGLVSRRTFHIFGCRGGQFVALFTQSDFDGYLSPYLVTHILDANRNGIPEIAVVSAWYSQGGHDFQIFEWIEDGFYNLLPPWNSRWPEGGDVFVNATGNLYFEDRDGDWIEEAHFYQGIPVWSTYDWGVPWRDETLVYKWDGRYFRYQFSEFDEPTYRFQAVQDGDRLALRGEFDLAVEMYQEAIFNLELEWWSPERQRYVIEEWNKRLWTDPLPTPGPTPVPDPDEFGYLSAYARFRIMLLHLLRGWLPEAETVFNTLQEKFPPGAPGYPFAEMAAAFWNTYHETKDIGAACSMAVAYVEKRPELLFYLGDAHHGSLGPNEMYTPGHICPFQ